MIVGMELRGGDLHSSAEHQSKTVARIVFQLKLAEHQPRRDKVLFTPVVRAAMVESRVVLDLRLEKLTNAILRRGVPDHDAAKLRCAVRGQHRAQCRLHVDPSEALAGAEGRRNRGCETPVLVAAGWDGAVQRKTHRIITALLIGSGQTVLQEQGNVAEAIPGLRIVLDVERQQRIELDLVPGHHIEAFRVVIIPCIRSADERRLQVGSGSLLEWRDITSNRYSEAIPLPQKSQPRSETPVRGCVDRERRIAARVRG